MTLQEALAEIQRLEDRIGDLEYALGLTVPDRPYRSLGIRPAAEKLIAVLMSTNLMGREAIYDALFGDMAENDQPTAKIIDVYLVDVRRALKNHGITLQRVWGKGWFIRPEDKRLLRDALGLPAADQTRRKVA